MGNKEKVMIFVNGVLHMLTRIREMYEGDEINYRQATFMADDELSRGYGGLVYANVYANHISSEEFDFFSGLLFAARGKISI